MHRSMLCKEYICLFQGLVAAIPLAFIIPALCYMKLEEGPLLSQKKGPALLLALFGIAVTTFGTIVIMTKVIKNCSILHNFPAIHACICVWFQKLQSVEI